MKIIIINDMSEFFKIELKIVSIQI